MEKKYDGSVYIGVSGPEHDLGICRDSIHQIIQRPGDIGPVWCRATKGYEARQQHLNKFMESTASFCLFLDHDMVFKPETLERLRSHRLPYVSGLYMRREFQPVAPIWFYPFEGRFPLRPMAAGIKRGELQPLGASGWGCILLHREVVQAVRDKILHGEQDIIEDDMDIWPYDLGAVMAAIRGLRALVSEKPTRSTLLPALESHVKTLEKQVRPLRADNEVVGSDIRYPFYALMAGYQLMGDPDVSCSHILNYPLNADDYYAMGTERHGILQANINARVDGDAMRLYKQWKAVRGE